MAQPGIPFKYKDLGHLDRADVVVVRLTGDSLNVRLLDPANFNAFRNGRRHQYCGGHVTRSPFRIAVPRSGRWYLTIDRGGLAGRFTYAVSIERPRSRILPPASSAAPSPLVEIGRNLRSLGGTEDITHDVFISHASEDKADVARPLAEALEVRGVSVWLDELRLKLGDSLRRGIDRAVATSRFGVVILSPAFFVKSWTQYELDGLVAREMSGEQIILPIWHKLTRDELLAISPSLTDKIALRTSDATIDEIADVIAEAVSDLRDSN